MKTRLDFVTNSSSTNFLIKKIPKGHRVRSSDLKNKAVKLRHVLNKMFEGKCSDIFYSDFDCITGAYLIKEHGEESLIIEAHDNYDSYFELVKALESLKSKNLFNFYEDDRLEDVKVIKIY